jgi:heme/copper-type cytochrome/quinol oxidase subunit 2
MDVADQIIKVIDKLAEKFGIVVDTSKPVLEQLAHNIVQYCFYKSTILSIIFGLILLLAIIGLVFYLIKFKKALDKNTFDDGYMCLILAFTITMIISAIFFYRNVDVVISSKVFPEKVVIEYVSDQYKKIK